MLRVIAIMARPGPVKIHPADKDLLKPLSALVKGAGAGGAVSFLRRTEYTASQGPQQYTSNTSKDLMRLRNDSKRRRVSEHKEHPLNIIRNVVKGFDVAYPQDAYKGEENTTSIRGAAISDAEARAWSNPKHPTKPDLALLDSYPVLPDVDAIPSNVAYIVTKFNTNPIASTNQYDERLNTAILRPKEDKVAEARHKQRLSEWNESSGKPQPLLEADYDYFLPIEVASVHAIKRKFDVNDPENEDPELYTDELADGQRAFKYVRLRTYETYTQKGDPNNAYDDTVAVALHDPDLVVGAVPGAKQRLQKAAYFYPIMQRNTLRPKRKIGPSQLSQMGDEDRIDELNLTVGEFVEAANGGLTESQAAMDSNGRTNGTPAVETAA